MKRCRCCLTTKSNTFFDIFELHKSGTTYADNISFLAEVQIDQNDGLSQQICFNCYDELHRIHEFCLKVRQADKKLRNELEVAKTQIDDENQMEDIQLLDSEYFAPVDDNGMQVCALEEIIEQENNQENILIVEEIHDEEMNVVEEISNSGKGQEVKSYNQKDNLLEGLALVAATQENVNIDKRSVSNDTHHPTDESDEDYLIVFDPNETNNLKPQKWKCGECKVVLRGDVSYEGHMNIHRKARPHTCHQCKTNYRCRTALTRHKDLKHSSHIESEKTTKKLILCLVCQKPFYSEITFHIHQAIVHSEGVECPFECNDTTVNNLKQHLESTHEREIICAAKTFCSDDPNTSIAYQCFKCSETYKTPSLLRDHIIVCQTTAEERIEDDNIKNKNKEESVVSVQCNVCQKKLLKRNLNKHMELHKRKEEENKMLHDSKTYLCSFCHNSFRNVHELDKHLSLECEHFVDLNLLKKHKNKNINKVTTKAKCRYMCKVCGNLYGGRAQLSAHKKLHKERPFKCDQCDKAYPRKVELQIHKRTHTGELPYECHLCDKRFAIKVRLTYHLQKHEGITHSCAYCSAVYNSRNKLKAHLFKHTGMPYKCEYCPGLGFERRLRFANHMNKVHQKTLTEEELTQMFAKNTGKFVHFKTQQANGKQ